jgi:hypothetical protein
MCKEAFKPTRKKIIISILVIVVWYAILFSILSTTAGFCPAVLCENEFPRLLPLPSDCCYYLNDFVDRLLFVVVVPFVLVYAVLSINQIRAAKK